MLWKIWRAINETVKGGESWYAALRAIRDEIRPYLPWLAGIGSMTSGLAEGISYTVLAVLALTAYVMVWWRLNAVRDIAPTLIAEQDVDTTASHDPALEQMIRMYILPASGRMRKLAGTIRSDLGNLNHRDFFRNVLERKGERMILWEGHLLYPERFSDQYHYLLYAIQEYSEMEYTIDHVVSLQKLDTSTQLEYDEWKRANKELKRQLTTFASTRGHERLYNTLAQLNWIVA